MRIWVIQPTIGNEAIVWHNARDANVSNDYFASRGIKTKPLEYVRAGSERRKMIVVCFIIIYCKLP
jgi:hypothetical protein